MLKQTAPSLLALGSWLILASLAFETRWKRNQVGQMLKEKKSTLKSPNVKPALPLLEPQSLDNKSVII